MPTHIRPRVPGASVFFTVALADRGSRLLIEEIGRLRAAVRDTMAERPFRIEAWVVLPDHMHRIWTLPEWDVGYSVRWSAIKARFTMSLRGTGRGSGGSGCRPGLSPASIEDFPPAAEKVPEAYPVVQLGRFAGLKPGLRVAKRETAVWQRRSWDHHIRDDRDFTTHLRYCWWNPVKHGLVGRAVDWPYASIHRDIRMGRCDPEWTGIETRGDFGE